MVTPLEELRRQYYVLEAQINSGEARAAGKLTATKAAARKLAAQYTKALAQQANAAGDFK